MPTFLKLAQAKVFSKNRTKLPNLFEIISFPALGIIHNGHEISGNSKYLQFPVKKGDFRMTSRLDDNENESNQC